MKNIIEDNGKFAIKEIDEAGNSQGVGVERFETKEEAQAFIDGAEGEVVDESVVTPEVAPENVPGGEKQPGEGAPADEAGAVNTENNDTNGQA